MKMKLTKKPDKIPQRMHKVPPRYGLVASVNRKLTGNSPTLDHLIASALEGQYASFEISDLSLVVHSAWIIRNLAAVRVIEKDVILTFRFDGLDVQPLAIILLQRTSHAIDHNLVSCLISWCSITANNNSVATLPRTTHLVTKCEWVVPLLLVSSTSPNCHKKNW